MAGPFTAIRSDPAFEVASAALLALDVDLRIQAANSAYVAIAGHTKDELIGQYLFDLFPGNPDDPADDGAPNLIDSLERVLRSGQRHTMGLQRYDVRRPDADGEFVAKVWSPVNSPLVDQGRVVGVLHEVEDVSALVTAPEPHAWSTTGDGPREWTAAVRRLRQANADLLEENRQLRAGLTSRATIDQAKGMLMARHGCGPEEAFERLIALSQQYNVKLRDIATGLVGRTGAAGETPGD
jgi:two-component system, response regulator / RNA-binding antiterminator